MTEFELAVEALMAELIKEIGSGLLTHRALALMPPVELGLQTIKRFEKEQAALLLKNPPENGLQESERKEPE